MALVLLVEDDERLACLIGDYLRAHGLDVLHVADATLATARILQTAPDLVLLDLGLGTADGLEVCRAVRGQYAGVLCIFSAFADDIHQVLGLELGADDYITKPIEPRVLLARLRAHLRRTAAVHAGSVLAFGALTVDPAAREARLAGDIVAMTTAEFDLLWLLIQHRGRILDRETLLKQLRGIGFDGLDRSIDARISRLRRKIGDDPNEPFLIRTVRGRGYLFSPPSARSAS
ncbi:winged helix-turn-helix domain-containing protein [Stenotrophomonas sp.]|uniref:winged helix-turn-helix domain-containing protein n=1 Tax=Stenotrophomonas sp. TaxID=69392 RepID=UPI002FC73A96